ncbi:MAG TPA: aldose epimerase family protein [Erysipelotrichaceae bacterium]|nr:aldose epimerase family protein [Erysipelotrichaceae bacterium]
MKIKKEEFGDFDLNNKAYLYTLENKNGMKVTLTNMGASIVNVWVLDKDNNLVDVALGHKDLKHYINNSGNLGCVVGRNANRIKNAEALIDGSVYKLEVNDNNNNLHTGKMGLQNILFKTQVTENSVIFYTRIKHLEDGFPGNLDVEVEYNLSNDNQLTLTYKAVSDKDTVVNLTNHSYFNLNGQDESTIYNHQLEVDANFYTPNSPQSIPTGEVLLVNDTDFDFLKPTNLKKPLTSNVGQVKTFGGLDHNFMLNKTGFRKVATLYNPDNHIKMEVLTDRNAMHIYTANHFPDSETINKNNLTYPLHGGIAFETQSVPNALNMPWLKSPIIKAKEVYFSQTAYKFSLK